MLHGRKSRNVDKERKYTYLWRRTRHGSRESVNGIGYGGSTAKDNRSVEDILNLHNGRDFMKSTLEKNGIRIDEPLSRLEIHVQLTRSAHGYEYTCVFNGLSGDRYNATVNGKPYPSEDGILTFEKVFSDVEFIYKTMVDNTYICKDSPIRKLEINVVRSN